MDSQLSATLRGRLVVLLLTATAVWLLGAPESQADVKEFPAASGSAPVHITAGPDGALWFTMWGPSSIGRATTAGQVRTFALGGTAVGPAGIASGPDGVLWIAEANTNAVARMNVSGQVISTLPIKSTVAPQPYGAAAGPDGAVWVTEAFDGRIARITPGGDLTEFAVRAPAADPAGATDIVAGPDGAMWFTLLTGGAVGRVDPGVGTVSVLAVPSGRQSRPHSITTGPDGALWFTEAGSNKIGRVTISGDFAEFRIPTANADARGIAAGRDGALWFAESNVGKIGRITTAGAVTEFQVAAAGSAPQDIVSGPDGALWFTDLADKIGRITTDTTPAPGKAAVRCSGARAELTCGEGQLFRARASRELEAHAASHAVEARGGERSPARSWRPVRVDLSGEARQTGQGPLPRRRTLDSARPGHADRQMAAALVAG
jgi:streptogramin lyase